jgi:hypothetical protein
MIVALGQAIIVSMLGMDTSTIIRGIIPSLGTGVTHGAAATDSEPAIGHRIQTRLEQLQADEPLRILGCVLMLISDGACHRR